MVDDAAPAEQSPNAGVGLVDAWELVGLPGRLDVAVPPMRNNLPKRAIGGVAPQSAGRHIA